MNIKKSTLVRTVASVLLIINIILNACGKHIIQYDEGSITAVIDAVIEVAIIAVGFWYNNSFSKKARKADEFLKQLKEGE